MSSQPDLTWISKLVSSPSTTITATVSEPVPKGGTSNTGTELWLDGRGKGHWGQVDIELVASDNGHIVVRGGGQVSEGTYLPVMYHVFRVLSAKTWDDGSTQYQAISLISYRAFGRKAEVNDGN